MTTFKLYEPENTSVMLFSSFKTDTIVAQDLLFTYTNIHVVPFPLHHVKFNVKFLFYMEHYMELYIKNGTLHGTLQELLQELYSKH